MTRTGRNLAFGCGAVTLAVNAVVAWAVRDFRDAALAHRLRTGLGDYIGEHRAVFGGSSGSFRIPAERGFTKLKAPPNDFREAMNRLPPGTYTYNVHPVSGRLKYRVSNAEGERVEEGYVTVNLEPVPAPTIP